MMGVDNCARKGNLSKPLNDFPDSVLAALLSENMATMDWNIKAKYPGLRSILERVSDLSEVLAVHKDQASGLAQSLVANQLASAGTRVYKYAPYLS